MTRRDEATVAAIGCLGLIPALVIGMVLRAWAMVTLWSWFIAPTWHVGAPKYAACLGISALLGLLHESSGSGSSKHESAGSALATAYSKILLAGPFAVACGWVFKHWM